MYLPTLAFLFATASAAAIDTQSGSSWKVSGFGDSHEPNSIESNLVFNIDIPGYGKVHCDYLTDPGNDNIATYDKEPCKGHKEIKVTQFALHPKKKHSDWVFGVTYGKDYRYITAPTNFYEYPPGSGIEYQSLDAPNKFTLVKQ